MRRDPQRMVKVEFVEHQAKRIPQTPIEEDVVVENAPNGENVEGNIWGDRTEEKRTFCDRQARTDFSQGCRHQKVRRGVHEVEANGCDAAIYRAAIYQAGCSSQNPL